MPKQYPEWFYLLREAILKEELAIERFERFGFALEGTLKDHYRVGENMYIYSKVYSR